MRHELTSLSLSSIVFTVKRDIAERGRSVDDVLHQYLYTVKPAFDEFIAPVSRTVTAAPPLHPLVNEPLPSPLTASLVPVRLPPSSPVQTKRYADIIIPRGGENLVAIDLLVQHIKRQLRKRGVQVASAPVAGAAPNPPAFYLPSPASGTATSASPLHTPTAGEAEEEEG